MRTEIEIFKDKILLLYLISSVKKYGSIDGNLKLQKLVFLSEWNLMSLKIKALHFKFFRYRLGPFSKELSWDNNDLKNDKYVTRLSNLTEKGIDLLDYVIEPISKFGNNSQIFAKIDETCAAYGKYSGPRLTDKVYDMKIIPHDLPGKEIKIRDIPAFLDILVPELFQVKNNFEIPDFLLGDIKREFEGKELTQKEKGVLIDESENRIIELILSKTKVDEKEKLAQSLIENGASERLLKKFSLS